MPKSYGRAERVASNVRREASAIIRHEIKDPRVKDVTITEVSLSPDLRNARIYVSFLTDDDRAVKEGMIGLESAKGFVRTQLAGRLKLRYMPKIEFVFDKLLKDAMRLDALIASGLGDKK